MTATDETLAEKIDRLTAVVHQLERVVRGRLAPPTEVLDYDGIAARGWPRRTVERAAAAGVFSDRRSGKRQGSKRLFLLDELEAFFVDGESGVRRLREAMGRD